MMTIIACKSRIVTLKSGRNTKDCFQIRGVASKQLVQDLVLTNPATFVSFQQVRCSLPTLDIHSNKERHRFDLRDNTDQTRYHYNNRQLSNQYICIVKKISLLLCLLRK